MRYTYRIDGNATWTTQEASENSRGYVTGGAIDRLAYYEDAEEEGRLIVLPRKPERLNLHRAAELILADEEGRVMIWDAPTETPEPKESGTPGAASPTRDTREAGT